MLKIRMSQSDIYQGLFWRDGKGKQTKGQSKKVRGWGETRKRRPRQKRWKEGGLCVCECGRMVGNASLNNIPKIDPSFGAFDFSFSLSFLHLFLTFSLSLSLSLPFSFRLLGFSTFGFEGLGALSLSLS